MSHLLSEVPPGKVLVYIHFTFREKYCGLIEFFKFIIFLETQGIHVYCMKSENMNMKLNWPMRSLYSDLTIII